MPRSSTTSAVDRSPARAATARTHPPSGCGARRQRAAGQLDPFAQPDQPRRPAPGSSGSRPRPGAGWRPRRPASAPAHRRPAAPWSPPRARACARWSAPPARRGTPCGPAGRGPSRQSRLRSPARRLVSVTAPTSSHRTAGVPRRRRPAGVGRTSCGCGASVGAVARCRRRAAPRARRAGPRAPAARSTRISVGRALDLLRPGVRVHLEAAGVQRDERDLVRQDVVHLLRDAGPLAEPGLLGAQLALAPRPAPPARAARRRRSRRAPTYAPSGQRPGATSEERVGRPG